MRYQVTFVQTNGNRPDGAATVRLAVSTDKVPTHLSDFAGGIAEVNEGVGTESTTARVEPLSDARRLRLVFSQGDAAEIHPAFKRELDGSLTAQPLRMGS